MDKKYLIIGGIIILLLMLAGILFFSGGSKPANTGNQTGEIIWWKTFEDSGNVQDFISDYQKLHKNTKITFVKKDQNDYEQELVDAIASGRGPDIFTIHNDWLPKHSDKIAPMPSTLMSLRTYKDTFIDVATADFVLDNQIYGIPLTTDVLALFYNKDLLGSAGISQPPTTWPELVTDVQKLTKFSKPGMFAISGVAMGTSSNVNRAVDLVNLLMLQNGTKFYSEDMRSAVFDQQLPSQGNAQPVKPGANALEYYTQFANPAKISYTWNARSDFSIDSFTQGKVAMMLGYSYLIPVIRDKSPTLNWDVSVVPQPSDEGTKINFANYWAETVSKSSKNVGLAWDFLKFISSKEQLTKYYAKHKQVSSRKDILPDQFSDTEIGVFAESALTARSVYKDDAGLFESVFTKMIDDVILRNFDPPDALRNAAQQINLSLQRR